MQWRETSEALQKRNVAQRIPHLECALLGRSLLRISSFASNKKKCLPVAEENTEQHPKTNAREDSHIVRSTLKNHTTTSRTISEETGMFAVRSLYAHTV
ncbi:hypothetical protein TNCV_1799871 [Trichonephila clavipes]|nr:hypothetical protein TNCV_1799871 [Trichonephila clavipes]